MIVTNAIRELKKIEMICINNDSYRLDHAYTKEQKEILKAFGIDANYMKKEIEKITDKQKYKTLVDKMLTSPKNALKGKENL